MQPTVSTPMHQQVPFLSQVGTSSAPTQLEGKIPEWLRGDVVRTCPAVFDLPGWKAGHWFDGLGLMYGFRIGADGAVAFRQNLLNTTYAQHAHAGKRDLAGFGTRTKRGFFARLFNPIPGANDNTNVHCLLMGEELMALTESNHQVVIDRETLAFKHHVQWQDSLDAVMSLAHPQLDVERSLVVNIGALLGPAPAVVAYEHAPASRTRREIGRWKLKEVPYAHSFGLSPKHVVMIGHPLVVKPLSFLWSERGFIDHFKWKPENGTRLARMDRTSGTIHEHTCEAFFVFHTVNTWEEADSTVMDILAYDDAQIVQALKVEALSSGIQNLNPRLLRVRMRHGVTAASVEALTETRFEFPIIPYMKQSGRPHSVVWGATAYGTPGNITSNIVRVDTKARVKTWAEAGWVFGEPLFAAKPGAGEDEGVLLTVGTHVDGTRSALQLLEAGTLEPVARATVGLPIPLGFHGSFLRA